MLALLCRIFQPFSAKGNDVMNRPQIPSETSSHRRANTQGLMTPHEVVVHVKQRNHGNVVIELFTECVRQSSKSVSYSFAY